MGRGMLLLEQLSKQIKPTRKYGRSAHEFYKAKCTKKLNASALKDSFRTILPNMVGE